MKIKYTVMMDDLIVFNQFVYAQSASMRKKKIVGSLIGPFIILAIATHDAVKEHSLSVFIFGLILSCCLFFFLRWFFTRQIRTTVKKLHGEHPNKGMLGEHELEIDADGLIEKTEVNETKIKWGGIERIETTLEYTFIFIGAAMAYVIPKSSVLERQYDEFIEAAREMLSNKIPQQTSGADGV